MQTAVAKELCPFSVALMFNLIC